MPPWNFNQSEKEKQWEVLANVDWNIGRIVQTLKDRGIYNNTLIVFVNDNGYLNHEHQLRSKGPVMYEETSRALMIVKPPAPYTGGKIVEYPASTLDIMPTILTYAGLSIPPSARGFNIKPLIEGQSGGGNVMMEFHETDANGDGIHEDWPMRGAVHRRAINGNLFKFVHYLGSTIYGVQYDGKDYEFYNLGSDPYEMNNILRRLSPTDNALERIKRSNPVLGTQAYDDRQALIYTVRKLANWQRHTNDPAGNAIGIRNLVASRTVPGQMQLSWNSLVAATSEVEYWESLCPGGSCGNEPPYVMDVSAYRTSHNITVTSLTPGQQYQFRVYSIDPRGNGDTASIYATA